MYARSLPGVGTVMPIIALLLPFGLFGQPGSLDTTFHPGSGANDIVTRIIAQPDSKILVGGSFTGFAGLSAGRIVRLLADGSVDPSFQPGTGFDGNISDMELQPDGNLLVSGAFTLLNGLSLTGKLVRLNADGTKDLGFGPPLFALSSINTICLQPDGMILIGGNMGVVAPTQVRLCRLQPDGSPDASFTTGLLGFNSAVNHLAMMPDGRILAAGQFTQYQGVPRAGICMVHANGALDTSFDPGAGTDQPISALQVATDGRIYIGGGFSTYDGAPANRLLRLHPDGTVDNSFTMGAGFSGGTVHSLHLQADGNLLCGGSFSGYDGTPRIRLCRVEPNGALDLSFDPGSGANALVQFVGQQQDGAVLVGGNFNSVGGQPRNGVARIQNCTPTSWYADGDGDGFGNATDMQMACTAPMGRVPNATDCDDANANVGAPPTWYADSDGDGLGDPAAPVVSCSSVMGYVADNTDCDDSDENSPMEWFADVDDDGYGDASTMILTCTPPVGYIDSPGDCAPLDPLLYEHAPCDDGYVHTLNDQIDPDCNCTGQAAWFNLKVLLEGPYVAATGTMRDDLRTGSMLPTTEPYTALGYTHHGLGGGEAVAPGVLSVLGDNAIVDWVVVELRDPTDPSLVLSTRACLLQRDGDIVDMDGQGPIAFNHAHQVPVFVAIRHRNHLGVMTAASMLTINGQRNGTVPSIDFRLPATATYGVEARKNVLGTTVLWMGDVVPNDELKYTGVANDRDPILTRIGGTVPTATVVGYYNEDVNLDGTVKYTGGSNDRDPILVNIGGTVPTLVRSGGLP